MRADMHDFNEIRLQGKMAELQQGFVAPGLSASSSKGQGSKGAAGSINDGDGDRLQPKCW